MSPTSTRKSSSPVRVDLPPGVRAHGRWYQKRPHRGAPWENITEVADGLQALRKELTKRASSAAASSPTDQVPRTLSELIDRAIEHKRKKGISKRTLDSYRSLADGPIKASLGECDWREVTRGAIVAFLEAALQAGRTTTGNRARAVLSIAYNYAIYRDWTEFNPVQRTEQNPPTGELPGDEHAKRAQKYLTRYVPREEFLATFNKLSEWHQDVLACAYLIGVRQGDLLYLTRDAIRDGCIYIRERKTARGTRKSLKIIMSADVRFHIERALARQATIASRPLEVFRPRSRNVARRRKRWPESNFVFCNATNQRVTQSALCTAIGRAGGKFDFRDIRATVVTDDEAEKAEAGVTAAGNILGHTEQMLAVYQKHEVKNSDAPTRGALPTVLGVRPRLRIIQGRSM